MKSASLSNEATSPGSPRWVLQGSNPLMLIAIGFCQIAPTCLEHISVSTFTENDLRKSEFLGAAQSGADSGNSPSASLTMLAKIVTGLNPEERAALARMLTERSEGG